MYPGNIFINSMFKSCLSRSLFLVLFMAAVCRPCPGEVPEQMEAVPVYDSTLIHLQDPELNQILDRAIAYQAKADSMFRLSVQWRKEAAGMDDPQERGRLQKRIEKLEDSLALYRGWADKQFKMVSSGMAGLSGPFTGHPFLVVDTVLNGITVYRYDLSEAFLARLAEIRETDVRPVAVKQGKSKVQPISVADSGPGDLYTTEGKKGTGSKEGGTSGETGMRILERSPYGAGKPFERDYPLPPGVFYRIQLAVYSSEPAPDQFGGLTPITTENIPGKGLTRYFAGKFTRLEEASSALLKVKTLGYLDAFIVGYFDGKKSSFSKLKALEK